MTCVIFKRGGGGGEGNIFNSEGAKINDSLGPPGVRPPGYAPVRTGLNFTTDHLTETKLLYNQDQLQSHVVLTSWIIFHFIFQLQELVILDQGVIITFWPKNCYQTMDQQLHDQFWILVNKRKSS